MKIYLDSIGCRLNQSEIERMAMQFRQAGHTLVRKPEECDLAVVNSCAVTNAAVSDSRRLIRNLHRRNTHAEITVTGCWSTLEPAEAAALPGVSAVIPNRCKHQLTSKIRGVPASPASSEDMDRAPIPGVRHRTRAFIKVQDGCDNHCTYCITTIARGPSRSEPIEHVLAEVHAANKAGVNEIVLTGVQLSGYGRDLPGSPSIVTLVRLILAQTDIPRVRLSSLEPWGLPRDLLQLWEDRRVCRQLHLPLQSGSAHTLRRMGRPILPQAYARLVDSARTAIPGLAVTTDIIVGFPGESEDDFNESLAFIRALNFSKIHVFTYSPRPETAAARLPGAIPINVARERNRLVRECSRISQDQFRSRFLHKTTPVLWESGQKVGTNKWEMRGLTDNYILVRAYSDHDRWNQLTPVRLVNLEENTIYGEIEG